jgi:hypothetical protein
MAGLSSASAGPDWFLMVVLEHRPAVAAAQGQGDARLDVLHGLHL